jgi:outer membrane immunogenic protein
MKISLESSLALSGLLAVISAVSVSGASAADLTQSAPLQMAPVSPSQINSVDVALGGDDWTGFYVGAHLGGVTSDDFSESNSAWTGGVQAGYLQQFDSFVLGGEISASLHDELNYELSSTSGLQQEWSVNVTGRAGVALGQTLIYGLGGLSIAELNPTGTTTSDSDTYTGAVFGAGIEQALGNGWSLRAEYQQTNYWEVGSTSGGISREDDLTNHTVTAGVNFRF